MKENDGIVFAYTLDGKPVGIHRLLCHVAGHCSWAGVDFQEDEVDVGIA